MTSNTTAFILAACGQTTGKVDAEQQKLLQQAAIQQVEATMRGSEADVTRYHLETVRQQILLAQGLAGTRQMVEQAVDNEKRADATLDLNQAQLVQQRQQLNVLNSSKSRPARHSRRSRRLGIWPPSISATPESSRFRAALDSFIELKRSPTPSSSRPCVFEKPLMEWKYRPRLMCQKQCANSGPDQAAIAFATDKRLEARSAGHAFNRIA